MCQKLEAGLPRVGLKLSKRENPKTKVGRLGMFKFACPSQLGDPLTSLTSLTSHHTNHTLFAWRSTNPSTTSFEVMVPILKAHIEPRTETKRFRDAVFAASTQHVHQ